jgi:hypothetical protein
MSYPEFTWSSVKQKFDLKAIEGVVIEAKKADIKSGLGQCAAEMVASQKFNDARGRSIETIYGSVTTGTAWRFMKLEGKTITVDLNDYPLPPTADILGKLLWMSQQK